MVNYTNELATRTRIFSAILRIQDLDELLNFILKEILDFLQVEFGGIYLVQRDEVVLRTWRGLSDKFRAQALSFPANNPPTWLQKLNIAHEWLSEKGTLPDLAKQERIQAWACIPLHLPSHRKGKWLGTIIVASRRYEALDKDKMRAFTAMVDELVLAIEHVRTYRNAQERLVRLQTLRDIDRAIIQHLNLQEVLHVVLEHVPKELDADAVAISLLDEEQVRTEVSIMRLPNGTVIEKEAFTMSESLLHWFVERREPVIIHNLQEDPRLQMHRKRIRNRKLASYLGVPLIVRNRTIGILHILTTEPKVFADEDVEFFYMLAGQAAIAIENARAYMETVQRADAVEEMLKAQLEIATAKPENVMWVVLESLQRCIGTGQAGFFQYKEKTQSLVLEEIIGLPTEVVKQTRQRLIFRLGEERGFVGFVALTRKSFYLPDCHADPRWIQIEPTIRSAYFIPLVFGERLFGVISLLASEVRAFPTSQRALADLFVHYAGAALESARLLAQTREAERQYRSIFENATEGIFQTTSSRRFVTVNPALARILGYNSPEELISNITDIERQLLVEPNHYAKFTTLMEEYGLVSNFESQVYRKDGHVIWVSISAQAIRDPSGALLYYEGTIEDITKRKQAELELQQSLKRLQRTLEGTVSTLTSMVEMRDPYTADHQHRVTNLACAIAREMGLPQEQIEGIRMAATIHDIGKIHIPAEILSKPGQLTEIEFSMIKTHPQFGCSILKKVEFPWPVAQIILQHHERMDGTGYPQGLSGGNILLEARILAVADVIEAMSSHRPYRPALGIDRALEVISQKRGILYDPQVVDACLKLFVQREFKFD